MKAHRLHRYAPAAERPLVLEEVPDPEPAPGELRVRVSACGVCRTDLHLIEGDLADHGLPVVPGHMVVGIVDAVGTGVDAGRRGERVGIAWLRSTCGTCRACAAGQQNLCPEARFTGWDADGGYAELATVPADWAYPIPPCYADEEAAPLLCAGIIGYRALERAEVPPGGRLGLVGFGNSAHVTLQLALARGHEVWVASRGQRHRDLARELGAVRADPLDEMPPESLDAAILFAPAGDLVPPLLRRLRPGGTLAVAGIHLSAIPGIDYARELFGERTLRSVTANTWLDGVRFLREAAAIPIRPRVETFPLAAANEALVRLAAGRVDGAAVLRPG